MTSNMKVFNTIHNQPVPASVAALCEGLRSAAISAGRMADYIASNPSTENVGAIAEGVDAIGKQLNDLADGAKGLTEDTGKLQGTVTEMSQTAGWISDKFGGGNQSVAVNNSFGQVVHSFNELPR